MIQSTQRMAYLTQTRVYAGDLPHQRGNCFATAIACLLNLGSPEEVIQVQELYDNDQPGDPGSWVGLLQHWLGERRMDWQLLGGHQFDNQPYLVIGQSPRGRCHVCIYQNGELLHDPYPDGGGLVSEDHFEAITPVA